MFLTSDFSRISILWTFHVNRLIPQYQCMASLIIFVLYTSYINTATDLTEETVLLLTLGPPVVVSVHDMHADCITSFLSPPLPPSLPPSLLLSLPSSLSLSFPAHSHSIQVRLGDSLKFTCSIGSYSTIWSMVGRL